MGQAARGSSLTATVDRGSAAKHTVPSVAEAKAAGCPVVSPLHIPSSVFAHVPCQAVCYPCVVLLECTVSDSCIYPFAASSSSSPLQSCTAACHVHCWTCLHAQRCESLQMGCGGAVRGSRKGGKGNAGFSQQPSTLPGMRKKDERPRIIEPAQSMVWPGACKVHAMWECTSEGSGREPERTRKGSVWVSTELVGAQNSCGVMEGGAGNDGWRTKSSGSLVGKGGL